MKHRMLLLVIGIPLASILLGGVTLYLAFNTDDREIIKEAAPLSKTSWRAQPSENRP